jgi:NAD(P)-dependent dehydrogenase (short-subunit alcohol dehydrogenase family)
MKILVTGGNRGLGKFLTETLNAHSISRETGHDITKDVDRIAALSLEYDVFINNAFDGPPHEPWANFAQTNVLQAVYFAWSKAGKTGHIVNIGSVGEKTIVAPEPAFETYRVAKAALSHASRQCSAAFKQGVVPFRTSLITVDRLDTELTRSRASWTGNGHSLNDVLDMVQLCLATQDNTCIEEIVAYVNFGFQP